MRDQSVTTKAADLEYSVTFRAFESLDEARDTWSAKGDNPDDVLLGILNAAQEQNAKQGGKNIVRKAQAKGHAADSPEIADAVASAQEYAAGYLIGSPRGGATKSGLTKTAAKDMGVKLAQSLSAEELQAILDSI